MHIRPFPIQSFVATTQFFGSVAGGVLASPSNSNRSYLSLQGLTGALRVMPIGSVNASSALVASQALYTAPPGYTGAIYLNPDPGATAPVALQEFSY
jgi:hypothetical protein